MRDVTRRCLQSLRSISYPNFKVVVVDNGSNDGVEEMVRSEFPEARVIQTGANLGYTGGNNRGLEYALSNGADYAMVLNPDTIVANPDFLQEMIDYMESNPDVGIAGPRVFLRDAGVIQNTVLFPPGLGRNIVNWFRFRLDPKSLEYSGNEVIDSKVLNGVCILLRANCLNEIGLFDENIFMYIEDAEMDYRARRQGWRVRYLPIDGVIHKQKAEGYHMTGPVSFLLKRNSVYYLYKTGQKIDAWGYAILSLALLGVRGALTFNRGKFLEYIHFGKKLAAAYRQVLSGKRLDESFGPPHMGNVLKLKKREITEQTE